MGGHTAVVCLVLLGLCCVLLLRGGENAGGIVSIGQAVEDRGMDGGMESQDEPAKEQELTETQRQTGNAKRATEEEAVPGKNKANLPIIIHVTKWRVGTHWQVQIELWLETWMVLPTRWDPIQLEYRPLFQPSNNTSYHRIS